MAVTSRKVGILQKEATPIPAVKLAWIPRRANSARWGNLMLAAAIIAGTLAFCYIGYLYYQTP